ncbi:alkylation response protein AidB-like acyl-CoA dehydrogenase [Microcella putealis]|uniref:Alkylation response protein AidB-like acyl-CoA dehydrogenase n=1 Tax=Microcella putealis TaxID=337005 RepID=A0A4Q7LP43_9MICO|nr:acyl-CoA dehydrogenase family protein [Microcella putealis]RZS56334.1 alkylation response protein AidB-like acyl-CoA dehydrogenase [Microcella putealis]TQM27180.1 alkylation response protein AidB-like acyl-CoA dehydrogenase [Microcella putealis]
MAASTGHTTQGGQDARGGDRALDAARDAQLLARIRERAPQYDRDNAFFADDLAELRAHGYLKPRSLTAAMRDQRLLAAHAPATALGLTMHLVWMGVARDLAAAGDDSLAWVLDDAAAGEVFAFAISERGNDRVMSDSTTRADRVDAGWALTGTKIFTTLSPAWTRLGTLARHDPDPARGETGDPVIVHGFLTRDDPHGDPTATPPGVTVTPDWDTLGMRATQSHTTHLEGAVIRDERVARILPAGSPGDQYTLAIFANFLTLIGAVYAGLADRALELAVESARTRTSMKLDGAPYAHDPDIRRRIADAAIALDALAPQLEAVTADREAGVDRGLRWFRDLTGLKQRCVQTAREVVDQCMHAVGGSGYRSAAELSRLQRDVLAGIYHPSDPESVQSTVASDLLGPLP